MPKGASIPRPSLNRLPLYYRHLVELAEKNVGITSSEELGAAVDVLAAQAHKDLPFLGELGRPGVGYEVLPLAAHVEEVFGIVNDKGTILVGAGRLGTALASYEGFRKYRLDIVALFDTDADKVGKTAGDKTVLPLSKLSDLVQGLNIQLGVIAVPAPSAQEIAELMVAGGLGRFGTSPRFILRFPITFGWRMRTWLRAWLRFRITSLNRIAGRSPVQRMMRFERCGFS
jgi:redox-sensing transcriptional repressor